MLYMHGEEGYGV